MANKPIVILGAHGALGSALAVTHAGNQELLLWDKEECDITNEAEVREKITAVQPEWIINCAAYNDVDGAEKNPGTDMARLLNAEAPEILARIAEEAGARFIHFSTDYIFDGTATAPYDESAQPHPLSVYGMTKYDGEQGALKYNAVVIRTSRLFGPAGTSDVSKQNFVDAIIARLRSNGAAQVVHEEIASPTLSSDLAQAVWSCVQDSIDAGIYHLTNAGACTWYEWAQEIAASAGFSKDVITPVGADFFPRAAKRPQYSALKNTKRSPLRTWQEALQDHVSKS